MLALSAVSTAWELSTRLLFPLTRRAAVSSVTTLIESTGVNRTGPEYGERPTTEDAPMPISPNGSESERAMRCVPSSNVPSACIRRATTALPPVRRAKYAGPPPPAYGKLPSNSNSPATDWRTCSYSSSRALSVPGAIPDRSAPHEQYRVHPGTSVPHCEHQLVGPGSDSSSE